ncbi:hypothetical protein BC629DRAFT_1439535 [Irpex lacteus]|nr:hypothetical protein BC629DRAFT_1439535 [Irpex lacteus]
MTPRVPQDVLDMIVDEACYDRETLKACSLVSPLLLHSSRKHLHRVFTLTHVDYNILSSDESNKLSQLPHLPVVVEYASELRLVALDRKSLVDVHQDRRADFWLTVQRFKHVKSLQLVNFDWAYGPRTALQDKVTLIHAFPAVHNLTVMNCTFVDADEITALALQFPQLSSLRLTQASGIRNGAVPPLDPQSTEYALEATPSLYPQIVSTAISPPVLRDLHVTDCHADHVSVVAMRNLLRASSRREQLESLTLSLVLNKYDPAGPFSLLPLVEQSLLSVHVVGQQSDSLALAYPKFDAISRGLRSLRLSLRRNYNATMMELLRDGRSSIWCAFNPILANVRSQAIRSLTFDCELRDIESHGIHEVQDRLGHAPFLHLTNIRLNITADVDTSVAYEVEDLAA